MRRGTVTPAAIKEVRQANVCSPADSTLRVRRVSMHLRNFSETCPREGRSPSGRESEPQFQDRTDRYDSPEVVRLGEIGDVSHGGGPEKESPGYNYSHST